MKKNIFSVWLFDKINWKKKLNFWLNFKKKQKFWFDKWMEETNIKISLIIIRFIPYLKKFLSQPGGSSLKLGSTTRGRGFCALPLLVLIVRSCESLISDVVPGIYLPSLSAPIRMAKIILSIHEIIIYTYNKQNSREKSKKKKESGNRFPCKNRSLDLCIRMNII